MILNHQPKSVFKEKIEIWLLALIRMGEIFVCDCYLQEEDNHWGDEWYQIRKTKVSGMSIVVFHIISDSYISDI